MFHPCSFGILFVLSQWTVFSNPEPIIGKDIYSVKILYPFVVLIAEKSYSDQVGERLCTGSLVSKNQVLTSAYCLENRLVQNLEAFTGSATKSSSYYRKFGISSKFTYNDYVTESRQNGIFMFQQVDDICILQLDMPDTGITPVVISYETIAPTLGSKVTFIGWGNSRGSHSPPLARFINLKVLQRQDCDARAIIFAPAYRKLTWANKVFCAHKESHYLTVDGDFGGPVIFEGNQLVGIAIRPRPIPKPVRSVKKQPVLVLRLGIYRDFIMKYLHT